LIHKYLNKPLILLYLSALVWISCTGCLVVNNLPAPGKSLTLTEPILNCQYYLYVPTGYSRRSKWPMVITCHGTIPWDTAKRQFDEWKGLAEQKGFLLVAPELVGTSGFHPKTEKQIKRQIRDEEAIMSIIRSIRGARSVDDNRIFLTGWSAGSYAVLFTGLRHPDVFRALSIRQGNFNPAFFEPCIPFLDRYQPVQVMFGHIDPIDKTDACVEWLRRHEVEPDVLERPGSHQRDPLPVFKFFADVIGKRPMIRINVHDDPADLMKVKFGIKSSFEPERYRWDFGDGQGSVIASPQHKYEKPGLYNLRVATWAPKGKPHIRSIQLQMPRVRLGATRPQ